MANEEVKMGQDKSCAGKEKTFHVPSVIGLNSNQRERLLAGYGMGSCSTQSLVHTVCRRKDACSQAPCLRML